MSGCYGNSLVQQPFNHRSLFPISPTVAGPVPPGRPIPHLADDVGNVAGPVPPRSPYDPLADASPANGIRSPHRKKMPLHHPFPTPIFSTSKNSSKTL